MTRIENFLIYLQAEKRYASHTIKAYKNDLNQFHAFCQEEDKEGMDLHFRTIRSWVVHLMDSGYSSRSVHRKLTSLRTYCKYLIRLGELDSNPLDRVLKPKLNKRVPAFVEEAKSNAYKDFLKHNADRLWLSGKSMASPFIFNSDWTAAPDGDTDLAVHLSGLFLMEACAAMD